jgi:acyl-CoA synthetase (AMP-forming)/AMP-acid ligase II
LSEAQETHLVAPVLGRIDAYLDHWGGRKPDAEFLIDGGPAFTGRRLSWSDTRREVDRMAAALVAAGLERGDRGLPVRLPTRLLRPLPRHHEHRLHLAGTEPQVHVGRTRLRRRRRHAPDRVRRHDGRRRPRGRLVAEVEGVERAVRVDGPDGASFMDFGNDIDATDLATRRAAVEPLDPAFVVYTSGSTGRPKGALLTHHGVCYCGVTGGSARGNGGGKIICSLPVNHVGSVSDICCRKMIGGGPIVFQERFDPAATLAAIARERVQVWGGVPTMFQLCANHPDFADTDLSSVEQVAWGGAAMPAPVLERLLEATDAGRCTTGYGMTETTGGVMCTRAGADLGILTTTVGSPIEGHEYRIVTDDGQDADVGEQGEIHVRGDWLMAGYWNRPDATADAIDADGWLHTGDLAVLRPDGNVSIVGRLSEMFKSGGYNVYPREVERCLEDHPAVQMASVVSIPDPVFDEVGHAFVVADADGDAAALAAVLDAHCRERLANYKVPKAIHVRDDLPRLAIGKVDRRALATEAAASTSAPAGG